MKKWMIIVLCGYLALSASACSPRENTQESIISQSQPESQSQSVTEPSIPGEEIPHQPGKAQLAEMEQAANAVMSYDWPENAWEHFDALEGLAEEVAALGVTVNYKDNWKDYNTDKVRSYVEAVQSGQDAFVTVVHIGYEPSACLPYAYYTEGQNVYTCYVSLQDGKITLSTPEPLDKDRISITDYGHFFGGRPSSFRVVTPPQENLEAYWKYVDPIGGYLTFRDSWQAGDFSKDFPLFIFEALCYRENPSYISSQSPYISENEDWVFYFPAEIAEGLLLRYFDIPVEDLRNNKVYIATENVYRIAAFQGGGAYPRLEVWNVEDKEDGTIAVSVAFVSLTDEAYGAIYSILIVKPMDDGSFRYISNEVLAATV